MYKKKTSYRQRNVKKAKTNKQINPQKQDSNQSPQNNTITNRKVRKAFKQKQQKKGVLGSISHGFYDTDFLKDTDDEMGLKNDKPTQTRRKQQEDTKKRVLTNKKS